VSASDKKASVSNTINRSGQRYDENGTNCGRGEHSEGDERNGHNTPVASIGIRSTLLDGRLDIWARLAQLRDWRVELESAQAALTPRMEQLDKSYNKTLDMQLLQQLWQMEDALQLLEMTRVKKPLELPARVIVQLGGFDAVREQLQARFASLTKRDRLLWLSNFLFLITPDIRRLDNKIKNLLSWTHFGQGRNLLLGAPSGMGKSAYLNFLRFQYAVSVEADRNIANIIGFQAPVSEFSAKAMIQRLIACCGRAYLKGDNEEVLLMRLRVYIRLCAVLLMFVDECEHIRAHKLRR
jgi:hypothetical protein